MIFRGGGLEFYINIKFNHFISFQDQVYLLTVQIWGQ